MQAAELAAQLARGETLHTEFKRLPLSPDSLAAAITAFANTDGGQVFLGVEDDGRIAGVDDLDGTTRMVDNVAFNNCSPRVTVLQETVKADEGVVVVVNVPVGDGRPYRTNCGTYYVRTSTGRRHASREELLRLFQAGTGMFYDETPVRGSTLADVDDEATKEMLEAIAERGLDIAGMQHERLLRHWHLIDDEHGEDHLTVAGVLLLAHAPQQFYPHIYISALRIAGTEVSSPPIDQKRIEGRLFDMLGDALRFLDFHLLRQHDIRRLEPEVVLEFPAECLREVLVNAIAHRDYTVAGPIRLLVFDDRVEVRTPGSLPNTVRVEQLPTGVHVTRNPTLYNLLLKRGLVTDAGSGIPRTIRLLRQANGTVPTLTIEGGEFVVALPRPADRPTEGSPMSLAPS